MVTVHGSGKPGEIASVFVAEVAKTFGSTWKTETLREFRYRLVNGYEKWNGQIMKLRFITVGGTIDKIYFDQLSEYQVGAPGVQRMLQDLPIAFEYTIESVLRKDSLDMTTEDRQQVRQAVERCPEQFIVITHGTDTMIETARLLIGIPGKRIVLTGAMQPADFRHSDATFNVGMAIGVAVTQQSPGVWITMSGQVFDPLKVRKNRARGMFESTTT